MKHTKNYLPTYSAYAELHVLRAKWPGPRHLPSARHEEDSEPGSSGRHSALQGPAQEPALSDRVSQRHPVVPAHGRSDAL